MPSTTNRGRVPRTYGTWSSMSSTPFGVRPSLLSASVTRAGCPAATSCGVTVRTSASRYRLRPTTQAVISGSARISTPTRLSSVWSRTTAHTIAVTPAARNALPRTVSPASASLTSLPPSAGGAGGHRNGAEDGVEDGGGRPAAHRGLDARQQPVRQHRPGQAEHVVGEHVVAA